MILTAAGAAVGVTLLQQLPHIIDLLTAPDSMPEHSAVTRNDFFTLIEDSLQMEPYTPSIMQAALSLVSGYYLSSAALAVDIPGVNVLETLDRLAVSRSPATNAKRTLRRIVNNITAGNESLQYGLPSHENAISLFNAAASTRYRVGNEALDPDDLLFSYEKDYADELTANARLEKLMKDINQQNKSRVWDAKKVQQQLRNLRNQSRNDVEKQSRVIANMELDAKSKDLAMSYMEEKHNAMLDKMKADGVRQDKIDSAKADLDAKRLAMSEKEHGAKMLLNQLQLDLNVAKLKAEKDRAAMIQGSFKLGRDTLSTLKEVTNLSVGKVLDVTFERDGNSKTIPVTINLAVNETDSQSIVNIFTHNSRDSSWDERKFKVSAQELSSVKDLIFCKDMKEQAIRQAIRDKSGFFESMMRRSRGNFWSGLLGFEPSLNNASAVIIATKDTMKQASAALGGDFDDYRIRERVFANTASMIFAIVDTKWEVVTFYHRNCKSKTEISVRELSRGQKGGTDDVESILKAYSAGSAPVFR